MPNKPIIDIDINDKQFKEFYEMFQEFQEGISTLPDDWKKVNAETKAAAKSFAAASGALVDSMLRASHHAHDVTKQLKEGTLAQKQFQVATRHSEHGLKGMAKEAKKVSDSIFGIGKFLFKTAAWGTGLFAGATFGADKLAEAAVGNQRSASGLGLTTGQYRAFNTDYGRYLNPSILGSVADAQNDYQKRVWLSMATGMSQGQLVRMNAADVSGRLAIKAHNWWNSTPAAQHTTANLQATGFPQVGMTLEDMRRLGATPLDQLQSAQAQFSKDSSSLNISGKSTNALYGFTRQLTLAGQKLETVLTNKLTALAPALGSFMTHLEKDAEILINGIFTEKNLKGIQDGLQTFANYLGSADFRNDVKAFGSGLKDLATGVAWVVSKINPLMPGTLNPGGTSNQKDWLLDQHNIQMHPENFTYAPGITHPGPFAKRTYMGPGYGFAKSNQAALNKIDNAVGLPKNFLLSEIMAESSGNTNALSGKGAKGLFQLMDPTSAQYGVKNPFDPDQNVAGGAAFYRDMFRSFKGKLPTEQLRMAIAAGNWGVGNVQKDVAANGNAWESHIPKETESHINRVLANMAKYNNKPVILKVYNTAGANVAVSTNAAGM